MLKPNKRQHDLPRNIYPYGNGRPGYRVILRMPRARGRVGGKQIVIGTYHSLEKAIAKRDLARQLYLDD